MYAVFPFPWNIGKNKYMFKKNLLFRNLHFLHLVRHAMILNVTDKDFLPKRPLSRKKTGPGENEMWSNFPLDLVICLMRSYAHRMWSDNSNQQSQYPVMFADYQIYLDGQTPVAPTDISFRNTLFAKYTHSSYLTSMMWRRWASVKANLLYFMIILTSESPSWRDVCSLGS